MYVAGHCAFVVSAPRSSGFASAPIVGSYYSKALACKPGNNTVPLPPRLGESMKKHDRSFSLTRMYVVQAQISRDVRHPVCPADIVRVLSHSPPLTSSTY